MPDAILRVTFQLQDECNNQCVFCSIAGVDAPVYTRDERRAHFAHLRTAGATELTIVGGEPTLAVDLCDATRDAREAGFDRVGVQTNGRRIAEPEFARTLASAGVTDLHFSVHAADAVAHDYHTGVPGSFVAALAGIGAARAAGITVVASTIITRSNYRVMVEVPRLLAARGVAAWCAWVPRVAGRAAERTDRIVPRLAMALPYTLHALDAAAKRALPAWIAGAPLCLLGPFAARALIDGPRAFGDACARCPSQSRCSGVDPWYLARFHGDELVARDAPTLVEDHAALRRMFVGPGQLAASTKPAESTRRTSLTVLRTRE